MREIIFRGKRVDNGQWVEAASILRTVDGDVYIAVKGRVSAIEELPGGCLIIPIAYHQVDPDTVGQYTGLTDSNGRKVFEGDVLRWVGLDGESGRVYVKFVGGAFAFWCVECPDVLPDLFADFVDGNQTLEVIGNIYDNPELLD